MPTWTGLYICPIYWSHGSGPVTVSSLTAGRMGDIRLAVNHGKTAVCGSKTMGVTQQSKESDRNDSVPLISKEWDVKRSTDILSNKVGMCGISFLGFHCLAAAAAALPVWKITPITVSVCHNTAEKFISIWGRKKSPKHVFRVFSMFWLTWFQALHKTSASMPETEPETQTSQQWKRKRHNNWFPVFSLSFTLLQRDENHLRTTTRTEHKMPCFHQRAGQTQHDVTNWQVT